MPGTLKLKSEAGGSVILTANTTAASDLSVIVPPYAATMATLVANTTGPVFSVPNVASNGPSFHVYLNNTQSFSASTYTKMAFNTKEYDTGNSFDATTNYRFQPTVAGHYQLNVWLNNASSSTTRWVIFLFKNGSAYKVLADTNVTSPNSIPTSSISVYANGTTDFYEIYSYVTGTSIGIYGSASNIPSSSWFTGAMVRSA